MLRGVLSTVQRDDGHLSVMKDYGLQSKDKCIM